MGTTTDTPEDFLFSLPAERREAMTKLRNVILQNLPTGYSEIMSQGIPAYVVPHSLFPPGYHCNPKEPLPFISLASHKNFIALYHMGLYGDKDLLEWFRASYPEHSKRKLDMGKSCIRFKKMEDIPYALIGELVSKMSPLEWIACYEAQVK